MVPELDPIAEVHHYDQYTYTKKENDNSNLAQIKLEVLASKEI